MDRYNRKNKGLLRKEKFSTNWEKNKRAVVLTVKLFVLAIGIVIIDTMPKVKDVAWEMSIRYEEQKWMIEKRHALIELDISLNEMKSLSSFETWIVLRNIRNYIQATKEGNNDEQERIKQELEEFWQEKHKLDRRETALNELGLTWEEKERLPEYEKYLIDEYLKAAEDEMIILKESYKLIIKDLWQEKKIDKIIEELKTMPEPKIEKIIDERPFIQCKKNWKTWPKNLNSISKNEKVVLKKHTRQKII